MGDVGGEQEDNYLLKRGGLASARLTTQHFVHIERQGWMLHPDVEKSLADKDDVKIADLATGNAIWATNLSKAYPNASIVGLDISSEQFPPSFTLPSNVSLDYINLFDPVPPKYQNAFDVIHIRLIVAAIYDKDTDQILSNILNMLKPGGYLQWDDLCNHALMAVDSSLQKDRRRHSFLDRLDKVTGLYKGTRFVNTIPHELEKKGMEDVLTYEPPVNNITLQSETDCIIWSIQELIDTIKNIPKEGVKEEMKVATREFQDEVDTREMWAYDWSVAIGRKSISA